MRLTCFWGNTLCWEVEKINSVLPSFLSSAFTREIMEQDKFKEKLKGTKPISFDSRLIPLSDEGVVEYFQWRQAESWRNCLNGYSYWKLQETHSQKEAMQILHKKKSSQLHEILFQKGINLAELLMAEERDWNLQKAFKVDGINPLTNEKVTSHRKKIFIDWELPRFDEKFFTSKSLLK